MQRRLGGGPNRMSAYSKNSSTIRASAIESITATTSVDWRRPPTRRRLQRGNRLAKRNDHEGTDLAVPKNSGANTRARSHVVMNVCCDCDATPRRWWLFRCISSNKKSVQIVPFRPLTTDSTACTDARSAVGTAASIVRTPS